MMLAINQIKEMIPHRFPILLADRILEVEKGRRAVGIKNITVNDFYCQQEYFNGETVFPGALQVELMAQVAGFILMGLMEDAKSIPVFASIDRARFRKNVKPGDQLKVVAEMKKFKARTGKFSAKTFVNGELISEAAFTCMITPGES